LIASVGAGGNASDIGLVKNLVTSYISKPSCLILLTVTCESLFPLSVAPLQEESDYLLLVIFSADFENQGAYELAKGNDPDGKRTIGNIIFLARFGDPD
jgi:hypothetical protein